MLVLNIRPNEFTFGTVIHSSIALGDLNIGKQQLHTCATKIGLHSNVFVGSAILDLYAKLSITQDAKNHHQVNEILFAFEFLWAFGVGCI
ncbi:hypothetical protein ACE6H2_017742 [Prunus campanulata]